MTLTKTQQKLVKTIQHLHRRGEPLNITAVKRRHPELMEAVYAVKPFWGWKKALAAAGIRYAEIEVDQQDFCVCEICNVRRKNLVPHLRHKHGIETSDYKIDYPEAEVFSETIRARQLKTKNEKPPHWEPLWTSEYVLDRLWDRYAKGLPMHSEAVSLHDQRLHKQATIRFGSFDNALRRLGLNPEEIRRVPLPLKTKKEVLDAIARRRRLNLPLAPTRVFFGYKDSDGVLYMGAVRLFGSWRKAIEAAGLDYDATRIKSKYPTPESVAHEIRRRHELGVSVKTSDIQHGEQRDTALYSQGDKFFRSWKKAIKAAGLRYRDAVPSRRKYSTRESVISEIRQRQRAGLSIRASDVKTGPHRNVTLWLSARRLFSGSWALAVRRAGFSYRVAARPRIYPTEGSVVAEIQRRQRAGLSIRAIDVEKGSHSDTALYTSALRFFRRRWAPAVERAGFSYEKT